MANDKRAFKESRHLTIRPEPLSHPRAKNSSESCRVRERAPGAVRFVYVFHQFLGLGGQQNVGGIYSHVENYNRIAGFRPVLIGLSPTAKGFRKGRKLFLPR